MNNIKSSDISVVVQGPIYGSSKEHKDKQYTRICCESIRKYLPDAEIVLSTWENSDTSHIDYDILVENRDPGSVIMTLNGVKRSNNTNRMILSTINGINKSSKIYCMRIRSDMVINGNGFLKYFDCYNSNSRGKVLEKRILTLSAINPYRGEAIFSVNDWFYFGLKEDLLSLYDIPLQKDNELNLCLDEELPSWENNIVGEQYVWINFLKKYPYYSNKIYIKKMHEIDSYSIDLYEESLADNLVLLSSKKLMVNSLKMPNCNYVRKNFLRLSCYTENEWKRMYKKYCDPSITIFWSLRDFIDLLLYKLMFFLRMYFRRFYNIGKRIYHIKN